VCDICCMLGWAWNEMHVYVVVAGKLHILCTKEPEINVNK